MIHYGWSARTLIRYALLQIPGLVVLIIILILVVRVVNMPNALAWGIVIIWVLKDIILFPFVWRAYDSDSHEKSDPMIGLEGYAVDHLSPRGYIKVRGELWKAELTHKNAVVGKGEKVKVKEINGLTLIVTQV